MELEAAVARARSAAVSVLHILNMIPLNGLNMCRAEMSLQTPVQLLMRAECVI